MDATLQVQAVFHLTGRRPAGPLLDAIEGLGLRPAMLARYRDLARLRYDFPLVLVDPAPGGPFARSLTDLVNEMARTTAPAGPAGEALRKHLLHVEREVRRAVAAGGAGSLSLLWDEAVNRLPPASDPQLIEALRQTGCPRPATPSSSRPCAMQGNRPAWTARSSTATKRCRRDCSRTPGASCSARRPRARARTSTA
jgi:hypothetical protein